jgi:hypothetical protein
MPSKKMTQVEIKWNLGLLSIVATDSPGGAAGGGAQFRPVTGMSATDLSDLCMEIADKIKSRPATLSLTLDSFNHLVPTAGIALTALNATSIKAGVPPKPTKKAAIKKAATKKVASELNSKEEREAAIKATTPRRQSKKAP